MNWFLILLYIPHCRYAVPRSLAVSTAKLMAKSLPSKKPSLQCPFLPQPLRCIPIRQAQVFKLIPCSPAGPFLKFSKQTNVPNRDCPGCARDVIALLSNLIWVPRRVESFTLLVPSWPFGYEVSGNGQYSTSQKRTLCETRFVAQTACFSLTFCSLPQTFGRIEVMELRLLLAYPLGSAHEAVVRFIPYSGFFVEQKGQTIRQIVSIAITGRKVRVSLRPQPEQAVVCLQKSRPLGGQADT